MSTKLELINLIKKNFFLLGKYLCEIKDEKILKLYVVFYHQLIKKYNQELLQQSTNYKEYIKKLGELIKNNNFNEYFNIDYECISFPNIIHNSEKNINDIAIHKLNINELEFLNKLFSELIDF